MQRLSSQNARFHQLIGQLHLDADEKKELVRQYSNGRTSSSADLSAREMQAVINDLSARHDSKIARMRAKARAIASDLQIIKAADYTGLNTFVMRTTQKPSLFHLDVKELANVITALEKWRDGKTKAMVKQCLNGN